MNIFADKINVEEFGSHNILEALIIETEKVIYLSKSTFNIRVCFSDNEDYNAVAAVRRTLQHREAAPAPGRGTRSFHIQLIEYHLRWCLYWQFDM